MKVTGVKCNACGTTIYSRAVHDYHSCPCEKTTVDGGFEYLRFGYEPDVGSPQVVEIEIDATKEDCYRDWNKRIDKLGTIPAT